MTGVAVPRFYNPAAVNPLKYAEQVQKRKLLWGKNKEKKEASPLVLFNVDKFSTIIQVYKKLAFGLLTLLSIFDNKEYFLKFCSFIKVLRLMLTQNYWFFRQY